MIFMAFSRIILPVGVKTRLRPLVRGALAIAFRASILASSISPFSRSDPAFSQCTNDRISGIPLALSKLIAEPIVS